MLCFQTAVAESSTPGNLPASGPAAPHIQLSSSSNQNYPIRNSYVPRNEDSTPDFISRVEEQRRMEEVFTILLKNYFMVIIIIKNK